MLQIYNNLRALDGNSNSFELLDIAPEGGFDATPVEPEAETFLSPDPPLDFDVRSMGAPFEPGSPEDMALWMIGRLSERLKPAMLEGLSTKVQKLIARREIMENLCCHCHENPEKRGEIWSMMQSLDEISSSEGDEDA